MNNSFKKWFQAHEVTLGSDGVRDNQEVQTAQSSQTIAQDALSNRRVAGRVAQITGQTPRPIATRKINQIAADAIRTSGSTGTKTTTPKVASVIARNLLGDTKAKKYFPGGVSFMKK